MSAARSTLDGHSLRQLRRIQRLGGEPAFEGRSNGVGAAAGGVGLVPGGDKGRAHGRGFFQTAAATVALIEVGDERTVTIDKAQLAHEDWLEDRAGAESEIAVDSKTSGVDDLARIHAALWIKEPFEPARRIHQLRPEVILEELGAGDADPVLGGERPAVLAAQGRDLVGDEPNSLEVVGLAQIEHGTHVQLAGRRVAVERGLEAEGFHDGHETIDIVGQLIRSDADVFDAGGGLGGTRAAGQQGQTGLPQRPDQLLSSGIGNHKAPVAEPEPVEFGEMITGIIKELDQKHGFARAVVELEERAGGGESPLSDGLIEEDAIDVLDGRRLEIGRRDRGLHGLGHGREEEHAEAPALGSGNHRDDG